MKEINKLFKDYQNKIDIKFLEELEKSLNSQKEIENKYKYVKIQKLLFEKHLNEDQITPSKIDNEKLRLFNELVFKIESNLEK